MGDLRQVVPSISSAASAMEARNENESRLEINAGAQKVIWGTRWENKKREPTKLYGHIIFEKSKAKDKKKS